MFRSWRFRFGAIGVGVVVVVLAAFGGATMASHQFPDVLDGDWFHDDVDWLVDNGITTGFLDGTYRPDNNVTRGQMAAFLHRMAGVVNTRNYSCAGTTFDPFESTVDYSGINSLRYRTSANGQGIFRCNVALPDGAEVTAVRFSVLDNSATGEVWGCEMWRTNLTFSIGNESMMASAGNTGVSETPGSLPLWDLSPTNTTIDNLNYAYFLQCTIDGTTSDTGIWGASVDYTIAAVPAP